MLVMETFRVNLRHGFGIGRVGERVSDVECFHRYILNVMISRAYSCYNDTPKVLVMRPKPRPHEVETICVFTKWLQRPNKRPLHRSLSETQSTMLFATKRSGVAKIQPP